MQRSEAAKLVAMLSAAYRDAPIKDATAEVYETMLADLEFAAAKEAIARLIATSKWLPTIAEIRSTAVAIERGPMRSGGEAYGDVLAEIRRTGSYGEPRFDDPIVTECVRLMSWRGLCLGESEAADRARFIELYEALAARQRTDEVAGRALPKPVGGLALPSRVGLLMALPSPKPAAKSMTAEEIDRALEEKGDGQ